MKYSSDKNAQILLSLLKTHNIRKVIASPGTTNIAIVGSMQNDDYFEMYSSVDERSAAYMACGLADESGEVVVIVCTGATASRNYLPGLTEAYYRKLPILVIAGSHGEQYIGHLHPQVIDRRNSPNDTVLKSFFINKITDDISKWNNIISINDAIISLSKHGGGPVLINIYSSAGATFDTDSLPEVPAISYYNSVDKFPPMPKGKIAVFIGSHFRMSKEEVSAIDSFCGENDAVVFCDHTSGYYGHYKVNYALVSSQTICDKLLLSPDLLIHIGEVSGDTYTTQQLNPQKVWRVNRDGELRDLFQKLDKVFEVDEKIFFNYYSGKGKRDTYLNECKDSYKRVYNNIVELEFGNVYIAQNASKLIPPNSTIHFSIFNSLRSWNFFPLDESIISSCNVGGFGIDGATSTLLGASLANPDNIHFLVTGDLAFFYDLNALGNRHIHRNIRILLINNGKGVEFKKRDHPGHRFGDSADLYIAAGGHFGKKSPILVKHIAEDLGFNYYTANNKKEFIQYSKYFFTPELLSKPIIFEVFVDEKSDVDNLDIIRHINDNNQPLIKHYAKIVKNVVKEIATTRKK